MPRPYMLLSIVGLILAVVTAPTQWSSAAEGPAKPADQLIAAGDQPREKPLSEGEIRLTLAKPVTIRFRDTALADVAQSLERTIGVPVRLDTLAIKNAGIADDTKVSFSISGVSGRAALHWLLRDLGMTWTTNAGTVLITTQEEGEEPDLLTEALDVSDLVTWRADQPDESVEFEPLLDLIVSTIEPATWEAAGGRGSIAAYQAAGIRAIVISQTWDYLEEIKNLLVQLRRMRHKGPGAGIYEVDAPAWKMRIRSVLDKPIALDLKAVPLSNVVVQLQERIGVPVLVDKSSLKVAGVPVDTPVTFTASGILVRKALEAFLRDLGLTWCIHKEVLLITTLEEPEARLDVKFYDVSDLPSFREEHGQGVPDYQTLGKLIRNLVARTSWDEASGPGSVDSFEAPDIQVLVVSQTPSVHEEVAELLGKLRALRGRMPDQAEIDRLPPLPKRLPKKDNAPRSKQQLESGANKDGKPGAGVEMF